jgi:ribose transport system permease protein
MSTTEPSATKAADSAAKRKSKLGFDRFSGLYVWALLIIIFAILIPELFISVQTPRIVVSNESITAILALGLLLPIAAGVFDLSIAGTLSVAAGVAVWFQTNDLPWQAGVIAAVAVGALIGAANGFVIVNLKVDSFIGTLGMSSVLVAGSYWVTGGKQVVQGISPDFVAFAQSKLFTLPMTVFYALIIAMVLYYFLQYRPVGRQIYAVGGNPVAARLSGINTARITRGTLVASGVLAAFAGTLLAARLGNATPDMGAPYLLPAFTAVFLGATQIRPGRVNVLGTLVAILLLATGVKGLQLLGAPAFITPLFNGVALIAAVALAVRESRRK